MKRLMILSLLLVLIDVQVKAQQWRLVPDSISVRQFSDGGLESINEARIPVFGLASVPVGAAIGGGIGFLFSGIQYGGFQDDAIFAGLGGALIGAVVSPFIASAIIRNNYSSNYNPNSPHYMLPTVVESSPHIFPNNFYTVLQDVPLTLPVLMDKEGKIRTVNIVSDSELSQLSNQYHSAVIAAVTAATYLPAKYGPNTVQGWVYVHLKWEIVEQPSDSAEPKD